MTSLTGRTALVTGASRGIQAFAVHAELGNMHRGRLTGQALTWLESLSPLGRLGTPGDVADTVAFPASDDTRYMTGHRLDASSGTTVQPDRVHEG
ncbi:SDR family oxidoreductase [Streptomyces sp. NPDC004031]